jgi:hypothetical protein
MAVSGNLDWTGLGFGKGCWRIRGWDACHHDLNLTYYCHLFLALNIAGEAYTSSCHVTLLVVCWDGLVVMLHGDGDGDGGRREGYIK